jgi:hypothetical protein
MPSISLRGSIRIAAECGRLCGSLQPRKPVDGPRSLPSRWRVEGGGKRGGVRVIYYHVVGRAQIRMILIYRKGTKDDLTPREKAVLRKMNAEW